MKNFKSYVPWKCKKKRVKIITGTISRIYMNFNWSKLLPIFQLLMFWLLLDLSYLFIQSTSIWKYSELGQVTFHADSLGLLLIFHLIYDQGSHYFEIRGRSDFSFRCWQKRSERQQGEVVRVQGELKIFL
jgi:hypothetical protein